MGEVDANDLRKKRPTKKGEEKRAKKGGVQKTEKKRAEMRQTENQGPEKVTQKNPHQGVNDRKRGGITKCRTKKPGPLERRVDRPRKSERTFWRKANRWEFTEAI